MMSQDRENSYSTILKRISSFGGVQVFNIFINIARGKFVAMFLGPEGMGVSSLFSSSSSSLQQLGSLGLNLAIVKETAAGKDNPATLSVTMAIVARLIVFTSVLGGLICFLCAPLLSRITFGNSDYTLPFMFLSLSVAFSIGGAGYLALLQGLSEVKRLSKASLAGGLTGLFCGVPLYYFFGNDGIVPAMIILSVVMLLFYYISLRRSVKFDKVRFIWKCHKPIVRRLISLGLMLMAGSLAGTIVLYVINLFIRSLGSVEDVGLFQAANSITNQYTGVVFSALAMDYFPRLSAAIKKGDAFHSIIDRQTELVLYFVTPLVIALIISAPILIKILLTSRFLTVIPLVRWLGFGIFIQAIAFPLGYIFVASDNRKLYIWMEIIWANTLWLACSIVGYYTWGLNGLGYSLAFRSFIDLLMYWYLFKRKYGYSYSRGVWKTLAASVTLTGSCFLISFTEWTAKYVVISAFLICSLVLSFVRLKSRLKSEKNETD